MGITAFTVFIIILFPVLTLSNQKLIYVSQTGIDDSSCWKGGYSTPCLSLNLALKGAQHYNHSITILLQPGQHQLHNGSETQLRNISWLAIMGNGSEGEVVITCQPLAGLAFFECSEIKIKNIKLVGCGALHNSTSQYIRGYSSAILKIQVAVLFRFCKIVQLSEVHVVESNGTGVILYNPIDVVSIKRCQFLKNGLSYMQPQAALHAGGGGLVIEAIDAISQSFCTITNSIFTSNIASSGQFFYLSQTVNHRSEYFGLGRGGGISVVFRGKTTNNTVLFKSVCLESNIAQFGGGMFLAFYDNTHKNNIIIINSEFIANTALTPMDSSTTSGGGIFIELVAAYLLNNTVSISLSRFTRNKAKRGGGITTNVLHFSNYCSAAGNKLLINNCDFDSNSALDGSSASLSQSGIDCQTLLYTIIGDCSFNNGLCGTSSQSEIYCLTNILIESFSLVFKGNLLFSGNNSTALCLRSSVIKLLPLTTLEFINNSAVNGAALHIVECSSVIVNNGTRLFFENNTAANKGGAIYVETCAFDKTWNCVFKHSNPALHPDDWNTTFTFLKNQIQGKYWSVENSVYIDSIQSCIWPNNSKQWTTFCWNGWSYRDTSGVKDYCLNQLRSGPDHIKSTNLTNRTVHHGECINLLRAITVYDVWNHDITNQTNLQADVLLGAPGISILSSNKDQCSCPKVLPTYGYPLIDRRPCEHHDVQLLTDCKTDYNHSLQILVHPPQFSGTVIDIILKNLKLCDNTCYRNGDLCTTEYASCAYCYNAVCKSLEKYYVIDCDSYFDPSCFKKPFLESYTITVCGSCSDPDFGIAVNFPQFICAKCKSLELSLFILIELLPVLIFMVILTVLHINIVNGNLNAFILYSQMVTLQFPGLGYTGWVPNNQLIYFNYYFLGIPLTVYSIWNLNFLTLYRDPFCIPGIHTAVGVILLQYVIAACPLLFIIVSYTWIQCYNNGYRLVVYTTRPVHRLLARFWQKLSIQPSLIDTYAGLFLLAYTRFLAVSLKLLHFIIIDAQSRSPLKTMPVHATLGAIAVLCLIVFVFFPMAVLFVYHFKIFQQFLAFYKLNRPGLQALVDAYQGCFKNSATDGKERRYFAGIYLLFRFCFITSLIFFIHNPFLMIQNKYFTFLGTVEVCLSAIMIGLVLILQPYKQTAHNFIDFLTMLFMGVIGLPILSIDVIIGPLFLPFFVLLAYLIYCVLSCARTKWTAKHSLPDNDPPSEHQPLLVPPTTTEVTLDDYVQDDLYADRILNPGQYK